MGQKFTNNAVAPLMSSIMAAATSLMVDPARADRFPVAAGADWFYVTLEDGSGNVEIVKVGSRAFNSNVLGTLARGQFGTTPRAYAAGAVVELRLVAADVENALAAREQIKAAVEAVGVTFDPSQPNQLRDAILRDGSQQWLTGVAGTNTITGSTAVAGAVTAYAAGQVFRFLAAGANTGAVTLNVNALGAKAVTKRGSTALAAGDIPAGATVNVVYDGTRFQLIDPADVVLLAGDQTIAGNKTFSAPVAVPNATGAGHAVNKGQLDAAVAAAVLAALPAGIYLDAAWEVPPAGWRALRCNGQAVAIAAYSALDAAIYCGDAANGTANWGYRCTDPANPSTTRSTTGTHIVLPKTRGRYRRDLGDGTGIADGFVLTDYLKDEFRRHNHAPIYLWNTWDDNNDDASQAVGGENNTDRRSGPYAQADSSTGYSGGAETRPYTYFCTTWMTY